MNHRPLLEMLVSDLEAIRAKSSEQALISAYREDLSRPAKLRRKQKASGAPPSIKERKKDVSQIADMLMDTIYEIHAVALFAREAERVELHVPRRNGSRSNYDACAWIGGIPVQLECKTHRDEFPYEGGGIRETVHPNIAEDLGLPPRQVKRPQLDDGMKWIEIPESTRIRQKLEKIRSQLPDTGISIALFGQKTGDLYDLVCCLRGADGCSVVSTRDPKTGKTEKRTVSIIFPGGIFAKGKHSSDFSKIHGVLWFRLLPSGATWKAAYWYMQNPNAPGMAPARMLEMIGRLTPEK